MGAEPTVNTIENVNTIIAQVPTLRMSMIFNLLSYHITCFVRKVLQIYWQNIDSDEA